MSVVKKIQVPTSDIRQSSFYTGNMVAALGNIETWLHMKALDIWREGGKQGAEPEFRDGAHPCAINAGEAYAPSSNGVEFWGVFPDDAVAKATFEAAVAEGVLLRTFGDYCLTAKDEQGITWIEGVGYSPLALQNKDDFENAFKEAGTRGYKGTYDEFCERALDFGADSANGDLDDFVNSVASQESELTRKAESGFYYGTIKARKEERGLLEGFGITLGDYNEKTGEFYAEVSNEKTGEFYAEVSRSAYECLTHFPADFQPTLHFRSDVLTASDTPEEEYTVDQLKAEKAFCEWWLNGPRRAEREVTKPEKITDLEVNLYQVNTLLAQRAEPVQQNSSNISTDAAPAAI